MQVFKAEDTNGDTVEFRPIEPGTIYYRIPSRFTDWRTVNEDAWAFNHITASMHRAIADAMDAWSSPVPGSGEVIVGALPTGEDDE